MTPTSYTTTSKGITMKTLLTTLAIFGLAMQGNAQAQHGHHHGKLDKLASATHKLAHAFEEEIEEALPRDFGLRRDSRNLAAYAHTLEKMIGNHASAYQLERYLTAMQRLTKRIDRDLHDLEHDIEHHHGHNHNHLSLKFVRHLLHDIHDMDELLDRMEHEIEDLHRPVILPHPGHGGGHGGHGHGGGKPVYKKPSHVIVNPAGLHVHKGGFQFNLKFK